MNKKYIKPSIEVIERHTESLLISTSPGVGADEKKNDDGSVDLGGAEAKPSFFFNDEDSIGNYTQRQWL